MAFPARSDCTNSRAPTVMAARVVNDAQLTWVAAEIESEDALRAWFGAVAPQRVGAYLAYGAAVDREKAAARDLQRLYALTQACHARLPRGE